jgi:hypothetical protein
MPTGLGEIVVAIGTWLYDGKVPHKIELRARPADKAGSRWIEDEQTGEFVIDQDAPVPATPDGFVYYVGATSGGEFLSVADAVEQIGSLGDLLNGSFSGRGRNPGVRRRRNSPVARFWRRMASTNQIDELRLIESRT